MTGSTLDERKAIYQGMLAGADLVHATKQGISLDVQLACIDRAAYLWGQLAPQATSARVAEIVSIAYTALSHEHTALDILSKLPLAVVQGIKREDLYASLERYHETIMYLGFAASEWSGVANDLYGYRTEKADALDQVTTDLCTRLVLDALAQRNRITALTYRLSLLQDTYYEHLLYPPVAPETEDGR